MEISDIDLVAALRTDIDDADFARLDEMQKSFAGRHGKWEDQYRDHLPVARGAADVQGAEEPDHAIISPGEPFHTKEAGNDWLTNWYLVHEKGATLYGADPKTIIEPVSKDEFIEGVKRLALATREWVVRTRGVPTVSGICNPEHVQGFVRLPE